MTTPDAAPILVIKHGALGDVVQALGPCAAIRRHHPDRRIDLLTTPAFAAFLGRAPYFDRVLIDERPPWWRLPTHLALIRRLHGGGWGRVYDLQTSRRSSRYLAWMPHPKPEWSGVAAGCSHPDPDPNRASMHTVDRQRGQLRAAGILDVPLSDLSWVDAPPVSPMPTIPYALLVPGGSAHRPEKRWPAEHYASLATRLAESGVTPVLIGGAADRAATARIAAAEPRALDLCGATSLEQLVGLGRGAAVAIGNDTGPSHLIAVAGAPILVLFSAASDPARFAPRTPGTAVLRRSDLADLSVDQVWDTSHLERALKAALGDHA